jgi:hypothetical protein
MSEPADGMGGKHLIHLGTGSETTSAYASIVLVNCSVEVEGAGAAWEVTSGSSVCVVIGNCVQGEWMSGGPQRFPEL